MQDDSDYKSKSKLGPLGLCASKAFDFARELTEKSSTEAHHCTIAEC